MLSQIQLSPAHNKHFTTFTAKKETKQPEHKQTGLIGFKGAQALKSIALSNISFAGVENCGTYLAHEIEQDVINLDKAKFTVRKDDNPVIGRVVIDANWSGKPEKAKELFNKVCDNWPKGEKVKVLLTCGGLAKFDWPEKLSTDDPMKDLTTEAEKVARQIFDKSTTKKLSKITNFVTLGIDSSLSPEGKFCKPHVELVGVYDIENDSFKWTGKSYPFGGQLNGLQRVEDLDTHFMTLGDDKVMVLGCHDLSIFGPRTQKVAASKMRKDIIHGMLDRAKEFKPTMVLQHPHTTDTFNTWYLPWIKLDEQVPSVEVRASAGKHYNSQGPARKSIEECLDKTRRGATLDMIVSN